MIFDFLQMLFFGYNFYLVSAIYDGQIGLLCVARVYDNVFRPAL